MIMQPIKARDIRHVINKQSDRELWAKDDDKILSQDIGPEPDPKRDLAAWQKWNTMKQMQEDALIRREMGINVSSKQGVQS